MHYINIALSYFTLGDKFLNLARSSSLMIVQNGNSFCSDWINRPLSVQEIDDLTEWSDMNLSIPILFNFYHGIELMLKGLLILQNGSNMKLGHKFSHLLSQLNPDLVGKNIYDKICSLTLNAGDKKDSFSNFLNGNNVKIDQWYEFLKYPFIKGRSENIDFFNLKYRGKNDINFWQHIADESKSISQMSARLFHSRERLYRSFWTSISLIKMKEIDFKRLIFYPNP